jgi:hypothetical protein
MKIAICLFGIIYGTGGKFGSLRDLRHCWPNIKKNLVDPAIQSGHEVELYLSTYKSVNPLIEADIVDLVKPKEINYCKFENSDGFTTKSGALDLLETVDADLFILTRSDIHFNKNMLEENIDVNKFNFLFPESNHWNDLKYTTDNFYIWPQRMTSIVKKSLHESYGAYRDSAMSHDTHGLYNKLIQYIDPSEIHLISQEEQFSDVNSYYTLCRTNLPSDRNHKINEEVFERFYK